MRRNDVCDPTRLALVVNDVQVGIVNQKLGQVRNHATFRIALLLNQDGASWDNRN
jgi:hypothetical protein